MAWNDTPKASERINATQPLIRSNFSTLQATFSVNHEAITGAGGDEGKHTKIDMTRIGAEPTADGNDLLIYNLQNVLTGKSEFYVRRDGADGIPFTATNGETIGWSYLPSGLLIKWGIFDHLLGTSQEQTRAFPAAANIPAFASIFNVQITIESPSSPDVNAVLRDFSRTELTYYASKRTSNNPPDSAFSIRYFIIGR